MLCLYRRTEFEKQGQEQYHDSSLKYPRHSPFRIKNQNLLHFNKKVSSLFAPLCNALAFFFSSVQLTSTFFTQLSSLLTLSNFSPPFKAFFSLFQYFFISLFFLLYSFFHQLFVSLLSLLLLPFCSSTFLRYGFLQFKHELSVN